MPWFGRKSICHVGFLLVFVSPADDFLAQPPYSPGTSFTDLGHTLSSADSDILGRATRALAQISGGVARVQGSEIASGASCTFAQAFRSLASTFANVLTAFADFLPRAGSGLCFPSFCTDCVWEVA